MHRLLCLSISVLLLADARCGSAEQHADSPIAISAHPQLFLDDHLIGESHGLRRELMQPERHPQNPLIVQDRPWEQRMLSVYGSVLFDADASRYRCWYLASESDAGVPDTPEAPGTAEYMQCYAESDDGIHWRKPRFGERPFGRHSAHNIVIPNAHGFCVLHEPNEADPSRRFKGLGGNVLGFSGDGINWSMDTPAAESWKAAVGKNDTGSCVVRWNDEYLAFVRFQEPERSVVDEKRGLEWQGVMRGVGLCVSRDFQTWAPKESVFKADLTDGYPWTQPYGMSVTPYGDVLIGLVPMLRLDPEAANNSLGTIEVQMVVSRDGRNWGRVADRAVFMRGAETPPGSTASAWDAHVYPSTTMLVKNDTVSVYYTGTNYRHGERRRIPELQATFGIGVSTLRADRFVALQPASADAEGTLETRPLKFAGNTLLINADAEPGDIAVELCNASGEVIEGFDRAHCTLTPRDELRYEVSWAVDGSRRTIADAVNEDGARLRFVVNRGSLYAFQVVSSQG